MNSVGTLRVPPVDISSRISECATHDSERVWLAVPLLLETFTLYSLPISRRTSVPVPFRLLTRHECIPSHRRAAHVDRVVQLLKLSLHQTADHYRRDAHRSDRVAGALHINLNDLATQKWVITILAVVGVLMCNRQRWFYAGLVRRIGMPFPHNEHNEEANYVRYRDIPTVTQPSPDGFCFGIHIG